nr:hypothetical protein [Tanacetum cinerariifolium]
MDTTLRYRNDNQTGMFGNQRAVNVVRDRENECRKPKRVKDFTYHKEKMLLYKQAEKGVPLQAEQSDWLAYMDEEIDEQELEAHYSYIAKIQNSCLVALQNKQNEFEKYKACNDHTLDYDKLKHKLNETLGLLAQKDIDIKEGLKLKAYKISVVEEKHDELVKQSLLTKSHYEGLVKEKTKVITDLKHKEERDIDKMISMEKQLKFLNEIVYKRNQSIQTIHMLSPKGPTFNGRPAFASPIEIVDQAWVKHSKDHFRAPTAHVMEILIKTCLMPLALKIQNDSFIFVHELKKEMHADLKYVESIEKDIDELESDKAEFSNMYDTLLQECVSNDVMCSYLHSLSDLDAHIELQCLYLHKVKECEVLHKSETN